MGFSVEIVGELGARRATEHGMSPAGGPMGWFFRETAPGVPVSAPDRDRTLVLYKYDSCSYCHRVRTAIARLGLDIPVRDTLTDPAAREALRAATGRTQVPCLFVDDVPLLESADIVAWLEAYAGRGVS